MKVGQGMDHATHALFTAPPQSRVGQHVAQWIHAAHTGLMCSPWVHGGRCSPSHLLQLPLPAPSPGGGMGWGRGGGEQEYRCDQHPQALRIWTAPN